MLKEVRTRKPSRAKQKRMPVLLSRKKKKKEKKGDLMLNKSHKICVFYPNIADVSSFLKQRKANLLYAMLYTYMYITSFNYME